MALVLIVAACSEPDPPPRGLGPATLRSAPTAPADAVPTASAASAAAAAGAGTELPFAASTPIAEASGAALLPVDGKPVLVVMSDGGNGGSYALVDPDSGATLERGKLPLGSADEDLEGLAVRGDTLYAVSSPGWMRTWQRRGKGFVLVDPPYPLGPLDLPNKKGGLGNKPPATDGMCCAGAFTNCGRNYEGVCLVPPGVPGALPGGDLAGFVAAKADGHLYALVERDGKLRVDKDRKIRLAAPGLIADCAFRADGRLFVGGNTFDLGGVYRVDGWQAPATATTTRLASLTVGFPEVIVVDGDLVYRISDTGKAPSLMKKYRCTGLDP